jgi:hypothetical protein
MVELQHDLRLAESHGHWHRKHHLSATNQILPKEEQARRLAEAEARIKAVMDAGHGSPIETMRFTQAAISLTAG